MIRHLLNRLPLLATGAALAGLQGCATQVNVQEIAVDLPAGSPVNGIPFRVPARFTLQMYVLNESTNTYDAVETTTTAQTLADTSRLYLLQLDGQVLSQGTVTFKLNDDATIDTLKIGSSSKAQDALTELGTGIKAKADAQAASKKADDTKQAAAETALSGNEDRAATALQARYDAELAALALDALPAGTSAVDRRAAEQKMEKLRLLANQAARRAGATEMPF